MMMTLWLVFLMLKDKRMCNSFDDRMVHFNKCIFSRIGLRVPFSEFELVVLNHLKISHSQFHPGSWA